MAAISGKQTLVAVNVASTHGTEVATTHLVPVDVFNFGKSTGRLDGNTLGINRSMLDAVIPGAETVQPSFTSKMNYEETYGFFLAQFMGTAGAPTEQNGGQGDYLHTLTFNTTLNAKPLTVSVKDTSTTTSTYPSAYVTGVTLSTSDVPNFLTGQFNMIANDLDLSSSTNTTTVLNALTPTTANYIIPEQADEFLINAQAGGALSNSTDLVSIRSFSLTLARPQNVVNEIKGSDTASAPQDGGLFNAQLTVELKNMADHTYLTAQEANTEYKCSLDIQGTQIGSGDNETFKILIPRMVIADVPGRDLSNPGDNPLSITFECLVASANPTGMDSTYPYFEITNNFATDLLA